MNRTILFPDVREPGKGKSFFLKCLAEHLPYYGYNVVFEGNHDIALENIRIRHNTERPRILRLNGVYHNTSMNWKGKNEGMANAAKIAEQVICQSEFSKRMAMAYLDVPEKKITVILNGSDPTAEAIDLRSDGFQYHYLCVSTWRPHKRLLDMIRAFNLAKVPNSCLYVAGKMSKGMDDSIYQHKSDTVRFLDQVTDRAELFGLMKHATAMLHLCWFDCCPNNCVEAVVHKCPVICSNEGGTKEIVGPSGGTVLALDNVYNLIPVDLYNPPPIDLEKVAEAIRQVAEKRPDIKYDHVDINNIAPKYASVFDKVS